MRRCIARIGIAAVQRGAAAQRRAGGPGWALVGDAGYFRDPLTAHGITDALRDAEAVCVMARDFNGKDIL